FLRIHSNKFYLARPSDGRFRAPKFSRFFRDDFALSSRRVKKRPFPRLNQVEMAQFLAIKRERLQWATREKIVERAFDGSYHPEVVTAQWLRYERKRAAQKS